MSRWIKFLIAIAIGLALGLLYGWLISPVEYVDTSPDTLRADYRLDYVLMVAETYQAEQNLDLAARRLAMLGSESPAEVVAGALEAANQLGIPENDRILIQDLGAALLDWQPNSGGSLP
jgi:hypothetical protein